MISCSRTQVAPLKARTIPCAWPSQNKKPDTPIDDVNFASEFEQRVTFGDDIINDNNNSKDNNKDNSDISDGDVGEWDEGNDGIKINLSPQKKPFSSLVYKE